jgi:ribosomal protein L3
MVLSKTYNWILIVLLLGLFNLQASAQEEAPVINHIKTALKAGSSKDLAKYFNDMVELGIDGEKSNYSRTQAEFVVRDFFKKNPPVDVQFMFKGSSKEGLMYAMGKYNSSGGTYTVYILVKQFNGNYLIDTIDFSKE